MTDDSGGPVKDHRSHTHVKAATEGPAWVIVLTGTQAGRRLSIAEQAEIGRGEGADLSLNDLEVSRRHAAIRRMAGGFVVEDLGSRNGTRVNGIPIEGASQVRFGDRVEIGSQTLLFTQLDSAEQQVRAQRRLETLGRLGAGIAHDFNNLLGVVLASVEYIDGMSPTCTLDDAELSQSLADIRVAAQRAAELTPRLLSLARSNNEGYTVVDVSAIVAEVMQLARRTFPRQIAIEHAVEPGLRVVGDGLEIHQGLMNLCLNARDVMTDGGKLSVQARRISGRDAGRLALPYAGPHVVVRVRDEGPGIDRETSKRIFEPFFTTKRHGHGFGLGLASVREMAMLHGGRVQVRSKVGKGSVFTFYLPEAHAGAAGAVALAGAHDGADATPGRDELVLIVDDQPDVRRSIARLLRQGGYRAVEGRDATEALAQWRNAAPALALIDLDMPVVDGEETAALLRAIDPLARVLFISGGDEASCRRAARAAGAQGVLCKPFSAANLLGEIAGALKPRTAPPPDTDDHTVTRDLRRRQARTRHRT